MKYLVLGSSEEARATFTPILRDLGLTPVFAGLDPTADIVIDLYKEIIRDIPRRGFVGGILGFTNQVGWEVAQWLAPPGINIGVVNGEKHLQESAFSPRRADFGTQGPVVYRPSRGSGSRGVTCRTKANDLEAIKRAEPGQHMCHEYLEGPQVSVEAVVLRGAVEIVAMGDRYYEIPPGDAPFQPLELGGNTPSALPDDVQDAIATVCRSHIREAYYSLDNWTCKLDVIVTPDGPRVIESHLRLGGGWFASRQIPYAHGVDLPRVAVDLTLGRYVDRTRVQAQGTRRAIAWRLNADGTRAWGFGYSPAEAVRDAEAHWQRGSTWMEVES